MNNKLDNFTNNICIYEMYKKNKNNKENDYIIYNYILHNFDNIDKNELYIIASGFNGMLNRYIILEKINNMTFDNIEGFTYAQSKCKKNKKIPDIILETLEKNNITKTGKSSTLDEA